ncbi:MAG TPA: hypothetical protein ENI08_02235 [Candidatus Dependentiae bacterium]|nr:hypothetical protein [Candidatus Dependentiae bacterium]
MNALQLFKLMKKRALTNKYTPDNVSEAIAKNLTIYSPTKEKKAGKRIYKRFTLMDQVNTALHGAKTASPQEEGAEPTA